MLQFILEYKPGKGLPTEQHFKKGSSLYSFFSTKEEGNCEAADSPHVTALGSRYGVIQKFKINCFPRKGSESI